MPETIEARRECGAQGHSGSPVIGSHVSLREQEPLELAGYSWDPMAGQYRSDRTGRLVSRQRILELLERSTQQDERDQHAGLEALFLGLLALSVWYARAGAILKRQHLRSAALAAGGWGQLDVDDLAAVADTLGVELGYLARLGQQIADGEVTERQATNRMNMYVGHGRQQYFTVERGRLLAGVAVAQRLRPGTTILERRRLDPTAKNCPDCIRYQDQGWQLVGALPLPTEQSVCDGNCRCTLQRREVPTDEVGRWVGHRSRQAEMAESEMAEMAESETAQSRSSVERDETANEA